MVPVRRMNNQSWLPDFFGDFFDNSWMEKASTTAPAINVKETENAYEVEVAAPGMTKEDFKVTLNNDGDLVVNLEKKTENKTEDEKHKGHYLRREFSYGKFQQTMYLPDDADRDAIEARVENGVLTVEIPKMTKKQEEDRKRLIEIK